MKAAILAGGKGTRLAAVTGGLPKVLAKIGGKPVLEHQIELLARHGVKDIVLLLGYRPEAIQAYFGDGSRWGVRLTTLVEREPLGTAGGLKEGEAFLDEDFFCFNGDVMLDIDLDALAAFHRARGALGTLVAHPNDHPRDSDLLEAAPDGRVTAFHPRPHADGAFYRNLVNAGAFVFSPGIFSFLEKGKKADLDKGVFPGLAHRGSLSAWNTGEYLKDMGTPERLAKVDADFRSGKIQRLNRRRPRPAIFLDRDGVLNAFEEPGYIKSPEEFLLLPGAAEAVRRINQTDYLAVLVTNQPAIARGELTREGLDRIHAKMDFLLGEAGAKLDAVYYCPHHPDKGFAGEIPELKVRCDCRKPGPGMLLAACRDFHIDLARSWMVGDHDRDMKAGLAAGVGTCGVGPWEADWTTPKILAPGLPEAVEAILCA
ncbi:MAG: HAD-IIIA family hydrolase [Spirochaetes bacterium]|nr:HAD-IIIA family hydrolase [Spirochaetota bacterium]